MREEDYREWQNTVKHYEEAQIENELQKENAALKSQLAIEKEKRIKAQRYMQNAKKNLNKLNSRCKAFKSQLSNIKYLNADEVEKIFKKYCYDQSTRDYFDDVNAIDAILNLAIPDIDREKLETEIRKGLRHMVYITIERCENYAYNSIYEEAFEIIKAIRGEK